MSTTPAGLQQQLDALQQFCDQRQLSVDLTKTRVVTAGIRANVRLSYSTAMRWGVYSHKYLGFEFHATNMAFHSLSLPQTKQYMQ